MEETAKVFGRLDLPTASYQAVDFKLDLERQRAGLLSLTTKEPVEVGANAIFSIGRGSELVTALGLKVLGCYQIAPGLFEIDAVGAARLLLDLPFVGQLRNLTAEMVLAKIASTLGLGFVSFCLPIAAMPRDMVFLGSVRGALDQVAQCFGFERERWALDTVGKKLLLLPGAVPGLPIPITPEYIREERVGGLEMAILARMRPFLSVTHRGQVQVVDRVTFDSKRQTMFLSWADEN